MTPLLVVEGADVERAQQLIEGIYRDTVMYTIAKGIVPGDVEPPSPLETAAFFGNPRNDGGTIGVLAALEGSP